MENVAYIVYICFALPFLLGIPIVRKKMRIILLFIFIGMSCCLVIAEVNGILYRKLGQSMYYITTNITPLTEEVIKAIPVLVFALLVTSQQDYVLTIAFMTGLGFSLLENSTILVETVVANGSVDFTWALVRTLGAGLLHSLCTTSVGIGITLIRKQKKFFFCGTFALLTMAIVYHSIYNSLIQSSYKYAGVVLPLVTYIPIIFAVLHFRKKRMQLAAAQAKTEKKEEKIEEKIEERIEEVKQ